MHNSVQEFFREYIVPGEFGGKMVVEAGSLNVNGTWRESVMAMSPREYIGTDMRRGECVDQVIDAGDLAKHFKDVDVVLCSEMMEHCEHWRQGINAMKEILKPGGVIYLTTRSLGFPLHDFPGDFWRYSVDQMSDIFSDFDIAVCKADPQACHPGVFIKAFKPMQWVQRDLNEIEVDPVPAVTLSNSQRNW